MNLIIDARMVSEQLHGIGRYTYELINKVKNIKNISLYILVNDVEKSSKIFGNSSNIRLIKMNSKFLSIGEFFELPKVINRFNKRETFFHAPSFVSSPLIKCKSAMTIHDLNHIKLPQFYSKFHKYYYKFVVKTSANKASIIFTDSDFSKNEIVEWLECNENKVIDTKVGVDKKFSKCNNLKMLNNIRERYKLPQKFILYVGNLKPHKNVGNLFKAMSIVEDIKLIINGKPNEELNNIINEYNLQNKIQFIGYVHDDDLPILYSIAELFVFPSIYEGFGLPPLEAMASGCPVITSNVASLPEVVGDAAGYFNPYDFIEIGNKINKVINDDTLRQNMIKKGIVQAKQFTWENTIEMIIDKYFDIIK